MIDVYVWGKDALIKVAEKLTRSEAKRCIDSLMAAARGDSKPKVVAYRFGEFAYTRSC